MRTVVDKGMVAHLWANKAQDYATVPCRNFYFRGDTIYSYGAHFPIARHVERKGRAAVLFTTRGYSSTTAGHKCIVAGACRHLDVFHVHDIERDAPADGFTQYRTRYESLARKYVKARTNKPHILGDMRATVEEANAYAKFYGLRTRLKMPTDVDAMAEECKAMEKRETERKKLALRKALRKAQERLQEWVDGKTGHYNGGYYAHPGLPIKLRIVGEELQTSHGAIVPLAHAVKAFRILKKLRAGGETYQRNGHTIHLGQFALDALDDKGNVTAGCHTVEWSEIERVAILAGVN